jgi:hypothetical protein
MIIHVLIPADEPERVARVIAELWRGEAIPFVAPGMFVAKAEDDRGTAIEVYARAVELMPARRKSAYGATHRLPPTVPCM